MTDFPLYDVPTSCRTCGAEYLAKSFLPADGAARYGLCPTHLAEDEQYMARLKAPHPRASKGPERREQDDRRVLDFRRRAAGDT